MIKKGSIVRLVGGNEIAVVEDLLSDYGVRLDCNLDGFSCYNIHDLEIVDINDTQS
jgi:hypothetical protein